MTCSVNLVASYLQIKTVHPENDIHNKICHSPFEKVHGNIINIIYYKVLCKCLVVTIWIDIGFIIFDYY